MGRRKVGVIAGVVFEGECLSGAVLDGGSNWQVLRSDGSLTLIAPLLLETVDGAFITMTYQGIRSGAPEVLRRLAEDEDVDPSTYYYRANPCLKTQTQSMPG